MLEVLSIMFGAMVLLLSLKMYFTLWDYTDRFGRYLGTVGLAGITVAVCYFGVVMNNYLYFGFAGMTAVIFFISALIWIGRKIKKIAILTSRFFGDKKEAEAPNE